MSSLATLIIYQLSLSALIPLIWAHLLINLIIAKLSHPLQCIGWALSSEQPNLPLFVCLLFVVPTCLHYIMFWPYKPYIFCDIFYIFKNKGTRWYIWCTSLSFCHMMIIQQANLLGLTHILKSYSEQGFKAEFCTVVHCLVIATSTSINLQSSFQKTLFLLFPAIDPRKGPWISDILQSLDYNFDAKL